MTATELIDRRHFYIDGSWASPAEQHDSFVIDPSTEQPCAVISLGSQTDTDAAVAAARAAFDSWSITAAADRVALLVKLLEVYERRSGEMAEAISMEMGAPIDLALKSQVSAGSWHIRNTIAALEAFDFDRPLSDGAPGDRILYEAV
ncbi:MAG: aldehyde dehydrogenase (NAD+), partial [Ilumatobacter sp.]